MVKIGDALEEREPAAENGEVIAAKAGDANFEAPPRYRTTRVVPVDRKKLRERRLVNDEDQGELADVFRILRTHVVKKMSALGASTLAITSPGMAEGKSLIAANLAISLSQFGHRTVLLVDLDLRRPSLHKIFDLEPDWGLTDHLMYEVPVEHCLINPGIERMVLLPSGAALRASSELLSSEKVAELAVELKNRYSDRIVVYDLPPLLPTDDALVFLPHVDCSLLVYEEGRTQRADIERSLELLKDYHPIGTVLNKARWVQRSAGYYRPGYYRPD